MDGIPFYIVDVFAEKKYAGNQLAVFRHCAGLSASEMQDIARETHFSETTFIPSDTTRDGGYDVRIFTPESELPFAGHPTIGTAYLIQKEIIGKPVDEVILNLKVGQIPVRFTYQSGEADMMWMRTKEPEFLEKYDVPAMAEALSISVDDIDDRYPIQTMTTGLPFIIAPLKNRVALQRALMDVPKFKTLVRESIAKGVLAFCPETTDPANDLQARVFVDLLGIPEDPATGSANSCLAAYLSEYRYFDSEAVDVLVEQGMEIKRPSLLALQSKKKDGLYNILVGGRSVLIAKGEFV